MSSGISGIGGIDNADAYDYLTPNLDGENPSTYATNRFLDINGVAEEATPADQPGLGEDDEFDYGDPGASLWGPDDKGVPELDDAVQGGLADCYAIASMGAIAKASPETIQDNIVDNNDGTYTVTFYEKDDGFLGFGGGYNPVEVTVDGEVPVDDSGNPVYAGVTDDGESWVMIYEKAYAEFTGGSYESIEWDRAEVALEAMSGQEFTTRNPDEMSDADLIDTLDNEIATVSTVREGEGDKTIETFGDENVVGRHTYVVQDIIERDGETYVELYNPWGNRHATLTLDQIREVSDRITVPE